MLALVIFMLVGICLAAMPQTVQARTSVRMRQRILAIPCGVDHLTDPDGTEHYFAPRICGKLVVPSTSSSSGASSSEPVITGLASIHLITTAHTRGEQAYLLPARKGQVYTFRLSGDSVLSPLRTFEVIAVDSDSVTLMFTPGDKEITLQKGGRIDADIAFGRAADVSIRVKDISSDGIVTLQVWFPSSSQQATQETDNDRANTVVAVGSIVGLFAASWFVHKRGRRKL